MPFPVGLEPLEPSLAPAPEGSDYPEAIVVVEGETEEYAWAHGRAYLHAPPQKVWKALQVADVVVDRRAVDEWGFEEGIDPAFEASFRVNNIVHDVVTVEFDVDWRLGRQLDEDDEVVLLAARFAKTDGTPFISLLEGSIVGWPVEEGIMELEIVDRVQAAQGGSEPIASYLNDLYADLHAWVHDAPLVEYGDDAR